MERQFFTVAKASSNHLQYSRIPAQRIVFHSFDTGPTTMFCFHLIPICCVFLPVEKRFTKTGSWQNIFQSDSNCAIFLNSFCFISICEVPFISRVLARFWLPSNSSGYQNPLSFSESLFLLESANDSWCYALRGELASKERGEVTRVTHARHLFSLEQKPD